MLALEAGGPFVWEASALRLEVDVAADGAPPRALLARLEAPRMVRDCAFGAGYLGALSTVHEAAARLVAV